MGNIEDIININIALTEPVLTNLDAYEPQNREKIKELLKNYPDCGYVSEWTCRTASRYIYRVHTEDVGKKLQKFCEIDQSRSSNLLCVYSKQQFLDFLDGKEVTQDKTKNI